jgi:hypothetical protein
LLAARGLIVVNQDEAARTVLAKEMLKGPRPMSAIGGKADIGAILPNVCF